MMAERHKSPKPAVVYDEVMRANSAYADGFGDKGELALPPTVALPF